MLKTRVGLLVLEGATDAGVGVALDVLRAANALVRRERGAPPFDVSVVSTTGRPVQTASGLVVAVAHGLSRLSRCDVVLVPGGWCETEADLARWLSRQARSGVVDALARAARRGALVGASCTATFVLAATGLLDGRAATTTWWLAGPFRARFPAVQLDVERTLTTAGKLLCAGTVLAMADLALAVVARHAGPAVARQCMRVLLLDAHPSQAPYMVLSQMVHHEPLLAEAEAWVRRHIASGLPMGDLARAVGVSPRTLARRLETALGVSPIAFVRRIRLEVAAHLLETSTLSLETIAERVGYRDAGTLRRLVRRDLGRTPGALRRNRQPRKRSRNAGGNSSPSPR